MDESSGRLQRGETDHDDGVRAKVEKDMSLTKAVKCREILFE